MILRTRAGGALRGIVRPPGDKSISHRALMFGALAEGETRVRGLLQAEDVAATAHCLREMGVPIWEADGKVTIEGRGTDGLTTPTRILDAGNSGTTTRLLMGIVASHPISASFTGDASLQKRPMDRIAIPLRQMGARIDGQGDRCLLPVTVSGGSLHGIEYHLPMASAQVKSAILLAGLRARGETRIIEPSPTRDHTERMLQAFGVHVDTSPGYAAVTGGSLLKAQDITVPGDFSAAAFFLVAAALIPGSDITIENVGLNPTRIGLLEVMQEMGSQVTITNLATLGAGFHGEPVGTVRVRGGAPLHGCMVGGSLIPRLIDEIPILCILAARAEGVTTITDATELRVKESDRIATMAAMLTQLGVRVEETADGMVIHGGGSFQQTQIDSRGDHRIAMSAAIAGLLSPGIEIAGAESIATSFPSFCESLVLLGAEAEMVQ